MRTSSNASCPASSAATSWISSRTLPGRSRAREPRCPARSSCNGPTAAGEGWCPLAGTEHEEIAESADGAQLHEQAQLSLQPLGLLQPALQSRQEPGGFDLVRNVGETEGQQPGALRNKRCRREARHLHGLEDGGEIHLRRDVLGPWVVEGRRADLGGSMGDEGALGVV